MSSEKKRAWQTGLIGFSLFSNIIDTKKKEKKMAILELWPYINYVKTKLGSNPSQAQFQADLWPLIKHKGHKIGGPFLLIKNKNFSQQV